MPCSYGGTDPSKVCLLVKQTYASALRKREMANGHPITGNPAIQSETWRVQWFLGYIICIQTVNIVNTIGLLAAVWEYSAIFPSSWPLRPPGRHITRRLDSRHIITIHHQNPPYVPRSMLFAFNCVSSIAAVVTPCPRALPILNVHQHPQTPPRKRWQQRPNYSPLNQSRDPGQAGGNGTGWCCWLDGIPTSSEKVAMGLHPCSPAKSLSKNVFWFGEKCARSWMHSCTYSLLFPIHTPKNECIHITNNKHIYIES